MESLRLKYIKSLCSFIGVSTQAEYDKHLNFPDWNFIHQVWNKFRDTKFIHPNDYEIHVDYRILIQNDIVNTKDGTVDKTIFSLGEAIEWLNGVVK